MILRSITITALPGIRERLHIEGFDHGINFVTGPNASGKTSIIRALHYLLRPKAKGDPADLILEAQFDLDGVPWSVTRTGQDPIWRRAGQLTDPPNLPISDALDCHLIRIEDLLAMGQGTEQALVETLAIEMDGGFNLRAMQAIRQEQTKATARTERSTVQKTRDALKRVRNEHRALAQQQMKLPELDDAIAQARQAQQTIRQLETALEVVSLRQSLEALEAKQSIMPSILAELTGDELQQLAHHEKARQQWEKTEQSLNAELSDQRLGLEQSGFEKDPPPQPLIDAIKAKRQIIQSRTQTLNEQRKQKARVEKRLQSASERLDPSHEHPPSQWPALSTEDLERAQTLARQIDRAHAQALSTPNQGAGWGGHIWLAITALALAGLTGLALSLPWLMVSALIGLTAVGLWQSLISKTKGKKSNEPSAELVRLEQAAQALAKEIGFQPALLSEQAGMLFSNIYLQFSSASEECIQLQAAIDHDQEQLKSIREAIDHELADWQWHTSGDLTDPTTQTYLAALEDWIERAESAHRLHASMIKTEHQLDQARQEISRFWQEIETIYQKAGLGSGEDSKLAALLAQRKDWVELEIEKNRQQALLEDRRAHIKHATEWLALAEAGNQSELAAQLAQHQELANKIETLQEQRSNLSRDIETTSQGAQLSFANAEHEQAVARLAEKKEAMMLAHTELFWLDSLDQQARAASGDRMFDQARSFFAAFTHHQWALALNESFEAIRTDDLARLKLTELSTATRMQLLLAVRMARVLKEEESREPLPIFIDEALTTSDPNRAASIIETLQTISKAGKRQIIYLAASDYELQLWKHLIDDEPVLIQLGKASSGANDQALQLFFPDEEHIPEPAQMTSEVYAQILSIGHWQAFQPAESLSLFYLMADDLDLLYGLMSQWRLRTMGAFERWLEQSNDQDLVAQDQKPRLIRRCQLTRRWWQLWHQGRARPLDESVLQQALDGGGLSEITLPGVVEAAHQVGFRAQALMDHLKDQPIGMRDTKRKLRQPQQAQLAEFLTDRGYLPDQPILGESERRQRAMETISTGLEPAERKALQALIDRLEAGQPHSEETNH